MAIQHYTSKGNFRRAATQQQNLAEIYEIEVGDMRKALEAYGTAAEWFESDHAEACVLPNHPFHLPKIWSGLVGPVESAEYMLMRMEGNRLANKLFLKVGDLAALEGDYQRAVENYEKVANSSVNNNLMKWSVKDYFLKAGMCHLASQVSRHSHLHLTALRDSSIPHL